MTFWELDASRNPVRSASAFAAASKNEIGPNAPTENPTLKPRKFNADEPICLFPRFDTLGGATCAPRPPRPGACASIEPVAIPATITRVIAKLFLVMILCCDPKTLQLGGCRKQPPDSP